MKHSYPPILEYLSFFADFLARELCPEKIRWISSDGIIYTKNKIYILPQDYAANELQFQTAYAVAEERGWGIKLTFCVSDGDYSYCYFYIPEDENDMDRILLNYLPKCCIPVKRRPAQHISNPLKISILRILERRNLKWKTSVIEDERLLQKLKK